MNEPATFKRRKRGRTISCNANNVEKMDDRDSTRIASDITNSGRIHRDRSVKERSKKSESKEKKLTQMFLDFGQKNFFSTTCGECGFVYTPGKKEEERLHLSHHKQALSLALMKFKNSPPGATVLMDDGQSGRIYKMYYFKNNSKTASSVMKSVSKLLQGEMGTCDGWIDKNDSVMYMYLNKNKEMVGCIILEANPVLTHEATLTLKGTDGSTERDTESLPGIVICDKGKVQKKRSQCAVRLMWTSQSFRRRKIASKLLDCARAQLVSGQIIPRKDVAFTQPSQEGAKFIQNYTGSSEFLVYE